MNAVFDRRVCPKCLKQKHIDDFQKRNGKPEGKCTPCRSAYHKEYNKKRYSSPEARAAELQRGRENYEKVLKGARHLRKRNLILLMGGKCSICGYNRSSAALDFDHIDPTTKSRTISHLLAVQQPWAWDAAIEESKKCRLVCSNCHREITYPGHELHPSPQQATVPAEDLDGALATESPTPEESCHPPGPEQSVGQRTEAAVTAL